MLERPVKVAAVQSEPVWFDMGKTVDKAESLIAEAAAAGAELIAFPETYIPGYPFQIWLDSPAMGMGLVPPMHMNSPTKDGPEMQRICAAAAKHNIIVSMGYSERDGGSIYMAQALIDNNGTMLHSRRKLKPTHVERSVFGEGDGSDLAVHQMDIGNVGGLCCWEHLQPLSKYAMYSQGEDIHCAAWPAFSVYRGAANALGAEVNNAASLMYAVEGGCFVVAPTLVVGDLGQEVFCDSPVKEQLLLKGGGFARIYGPDGSMLADPIPEDEEGILYADCDPALQMISKSVADPTGHYSRPDVTRLVLNKAPSPPVIVVDRMDDPAAEDFSAPETIEV